MFVVVSERKSDLTHKAIRPAHFSKRRALIGSARVDWVQVQPHALRSSNLSVVTPACKLPVFLLHYVIAEKGVGHGRTGIVQG